MEKALDGRKFTQMVIAGSTHLTNNAKKIDALNVFPVPDGDTGTNMNLSVNSGAEEVKKVKDNHIATVASAFAKGLLMGARGNSGVILSQLFRGFSKSMEGKDILTADGFATALDQGVQTAYKAVMKPVEGTILTVAKDAAAIAMKEAEQDIITLMEKVVKEAKLSLTRTPELLPVLKEVGVVDSGGQGLVTIYEGFLAALKEEDLPEEEPTDTELDEMINAEHHKLAQDFMDTSEIQYGYCTEFMVKFEKDKLTEHPFDEDDFRRTLSNYGDSLLVVADEEIAKVHVHVEQPGKALTIGQQYGSLINIKIDNMREQHTAIVNNDEANEQSAESVKSEYAIVTVAMGEGIKSLFKSMGASVVIEGGQTMNPSTQDIADAITAANANNVLILPNNKNIVMAAEQAAELAEGNVEVVPTKTIPHGIGAILAFQPSENIATNRENMKQATQDITSGQVTYAVRDTQIEGLSIENGSYMGLTDGQIKATDQDKTETAKMLLREIVTDDKEIITILYGEDVTDEEVNTLAEELERVYQDMEVEIHRGNQPIYPYIISVE